MIGVSKEEMLLWPVPFSGEGSRRLATGEHLAARECHFSDGSPSRKLLSAHRGWGFPKADEMVSAVALAITINEISFHPVIRALDFRVQQSYF